MLAVATGAALLAGAAFVFGAWVGHAAAERAHEREQERARGRCPVHALAHASLRRELTRRALGERCASCGLEEPPP